MKNKKNLLILLLLFMLIISCSESNKEPELSGEEKERYDEITKIYQERDLLNNGSNFEKLAIKTEEFQQKFPNSKKIDEIKEKEKEAIEALQKLNDELKAKEERIKSELEEEKIKKEKMEQIKKALSGFSKDYDDFKDVSFYNSPNYIEDYGKLRIYIGSKGKYPKDYNDIWFRKRFTYIGNEWLFFNNIKIKTDENLYEFNIGRHDKYEKVLHGGQVIEYIDLHFYKDEIPMLRDIVNSKEVKIRYEGDKYYRDRNLTSNEKKNLKKVLEFMNFYYGL